MEHKAFVELPPLTPDELLTAEAEFQRECPDRFYVTGILPRLVQDHDLSEVENRIPLLSLAGLAGTLSEKLKAGDDNVARFFEKLAEVCRTELAQRLP